MRASWAIMALGVVVGCTTRITVPSLEEDADPESPTEPSPDAPSPPAATPPPGASAWPPFEPPAPLVHRLTNEQLGFVIEDLFGAPIPEALAAALPEDRPLAGFIHLPEGQAAAPGHVLGYAGIADDVSRRPSSASFLDTLPSCPNPSTPACRGRFVASLSRVLYRGSGTPEAHARLEALYAEVETLADGPRARRAVLEAALQSPHFLYRIEDESAPSPQALAQRLSFALWSSAPDAELSAAADAGQLPERLAAEAARMLEDPRAQRPWHRFALDWARLESLPDEDGLKDDLLSSATAALAHHLESGGSVLDLFAGEAIYLTGALAEARGLTSQGPGVEAYPSSEFGGFLAHPGVVAGMTNADGGEIVARGLFLQGQLFCGFPPDPPASLQEAIDDFAAEQPADASEREIAERRMMRVECGACHAQFDPLGYAFEGFDHRGHPRTEDHFGNVVDDAGWIPGVHRDDGRQASFDDRAGFFALAAESRKVQRCLAQRWLELLWGHALGDRQMSAIDALASALAEGSGTYADLVAEAISHPAFRGEP
ncbi:MAG: DUF1592 domain-containing protein [Myxococcota bacterium]